MRVFPVLLPALLLGACATPQSLSLERAEADPWEASNRRVYALNKKLDQYAVKPASTAYRTVVPKAARTGVSNVYQNYVEPRNFLGYMLQGKIKLAFRSLDRLILNTTLGVGGLADVATDLGRPQQNTDFGQTLAQWGVKAGPYVMLPFFGPATLRDGMMTPVDLIVDPADIARNAAFSPSLYWRAGQIAGRVIELRSRLTDAGGDAILADSLDEYTLIKSAYLQRRRAQLYYGNPPPTAEELEEYQNAETPTAETPPAETPAEPAPPVPPQP